MAAEVSRLIELRDKLSSGDEALETLEALNTLLESCPSNAEILQISTVIGPDLIFRYLAGPQEPEILQAACTVLHKMLLAFPLPQLLKLTQEIELGLQHDSEPVRLLCLKLLNQKVISSPSYSQLTLHPTMFHLITCLIGDEILACAQSATNIIEALFQSSMSIFTSPGPLREGFVLDLRSLLAKGDVVRFRVYNLLVCLSLVSSDVLAFIRSEGFIDSLIAELESDDILIKLNCLEVLQTLAESESGLEVIVASDVLKKLHVILEERTSDPFAVMILPGIIKFFGHYCHLDSVDTVHTCTAYPAFLSTVLEAAGNPEEDTVWGVAVDTFSLLCSTLNGRETLQAHSDKVNAVINGLGQFVLQSRSELRVRSLDALSLILSCDEMSHDPGEASTSYRWCSGAMPDFVSVAMAIAKQPFPDLRYASLGFLLSVSRWGWGQREMGACPGFVEYLLDRKTESEKKGKEMKYEIIRTMAESSDCEEIMGGPLYLKLKEYVSEGPFYVFTESSTVAVEDES